MRERGMVCLEPDEEVEGEAVGTREGEAGVVAVPETPGASAEMEELRVLLSLRTGL